jgi:hypothetical protein
MTPTTTVPFTITDEAVELLREFGLQKEFDQIIEQRTMRGIARMY